MHVCNLTWILKSPINWTFLFFLYFVDISLVQEMFSSEELKLGRNHICCGKLGWKPRWMHLRKVFQLTVQCTGAILRGILSSKSTQNKSCLRDWRLTKYTQFWLPHWKKNPEVITWHQCHVVRKSKSWSAVLQNKNQYLFQWQTSKIIISPIWGFTRSWHKSQLVYKKIYLS